MLSIIKNLKKYKKQVALVFVLLIIQAICDLSLPNYTSDMIDTGIQNNGIIYAVPARLTASSYDAMQMLMTEQELSDWQNAYEPDGDFYSLKAGAGIEALDKKFTTPVAIYYMISQADFSKVGASGASGSSAMDMSDLDLSQLKLTDSQFHALTDAILPAIDWDAVQNTYGLSRDTVAAVLKNLSADTLTKLSSSMGAGNTPNLEELIDTSKIDPSAMTGALGIDMENADIAGLITKFGLTDSNIQALIKAITPAIDMKAVNKALGINEKALGVILNSLNIDTLTKLTSIRADSLDIMSLVDFSKVDFAKLMAVMGTDVGSMDIQKMMDGMTDEQKTAVIKAVLPAIDRAALSKQTGMSEKLVSAMLDKLDTATLLQLMSADMNFELSTTDLVACVDITRIDPMTLLSSLGTGASAVFSGGDLNDAELQLVVDVVIPAIDSKKLSEKTGLPEKSAEVFLENVDKETLGHFMAADSGSEPAAFDMSACIDYSKIDYQALFGAVGTDYTDFNLNSMTDKQIDALMDILLPAIKWDTVSEMTGFSKETVIEFFDALGASGLKKMMAVMEKGAGKLDFEDFLDVSDIDTKALMTALDLDMATLLDRSGITDEGLQTLLQAVTKAVDWDKVKDQFGINKETADIVLKALTVDSVKKLLSLSGGAMPDMTGLIVQSKIDTAALLGALGVDTSSFEKMVNTMPDSLKPMMQNMMRSVRAQMDTKVSALGESILHSSAVAFVKAEYTRLGTDLNSIQTAYLWKTGVRMLLMTLVMMLTAICIGYIASRTGAGVGRDLREKVFGRVVSFSSYDIDKFSTASLITRSTNDIQQVQFVTSMILRFALYAPIMSVGGIIMVARTGADMWWLIATAVGVILSVVGTLASITMPKFKKMQTLIDKVNLISREILTGLPVIRAFGREDEEEERFDGSNKELTKTMLFTGRMMSAMFPILMVAMYILAVTIVWVSARRIDAGTLEVGAMTAFITYALMIVMGFLMLTFISIMLPRAAVAAGRIQEIIATEPSVKDAAVTEEITDKKGVVTFDHVSFTYPEADAETLTDISFTALPGQTTALIGSTGCGKTTLISLIPRFYDVTAGTLLIDGKDVKMLKQNALREMIGYVPQKGVLFSGTIESNLRFGASGANEDEIREAAVIAQADDFIEEKEEKYASPIAQGGGNVSGGQKQRLSIARAIAKNPKIYVFDDSFSALDFKTDIALRKALAPKVKDSTVIIVAQRISTILYAEQIVVLDDGKIAGIGTHRQLMQSCPVYAQIALSQLSQKELEEAAAERSGG